MYYERLKKAYDASGLSKKQLAEKAKVSEKTIKRMLDNPDYRADVVTTEQVAAALNLSMQELYAETDVVLIRKEELVELEHAKQMVDSLKNNSEDNAILIARVACLENQIEKLQTKLRHREEVIAIHESYKSLLDGFAQILNERAHDTP